MLVTRKNGTNTVGAGSCSLLGSFVNHDHDFSAKADTARKPRTDTDVSLLQVPLSGLTGNSSPLSSYNTEVSDGGFRLSSPGNSSLLSRWSQNFPVKFK